MMRRVFLFLLFILTSCSIVQLKSSYYEVPPSRHLIRALADPERSKSGTFIVLIGANTSLEHRGNLSLAYQVLIEKGYNPNDFYIFDSASETPYYPKTDWTTRKALELMFNHIQMRGNEVKEVIIYVTGHGVRKNGNSHIMLNPSEVISAHDFLGLVNKLVLKKGFLFLDQCFWGKELVPAGCEWTTITVSTNETTSNGVSFPRMFWQTFRKGNQIKVSFDFARKNDTASKNGNNSPSIRLGCNL